MPALNALLLTYRRSLSIGGSVLLLYTLLGFLFVPWLVERQLTGTLAQRLQLTAAVDSIYFNPYTFYFGIRGLQVADDQSGALLNLGDLHLNFQATRLALLKLQFAEVSVSDLQVWFARESNEDNTLGTLAERWALSTPSDTAAAEPEATADSDEIVPLQILSLQLENLQLHVSDAVPATPFATTLRLASARIDGLSTLADEQGNNALTLHFEDDARLDWQGGFSLNPLDFNGSIVLTDFSLPALARYFQDSLPLELQTGRLQVGFSYDVSLLDAPEVTLTGISVQLQNLSAIESNAPAPFFSADGIGFEEGSVRIPENQVTVPSLQFQNLQIAAARDNTGSLNLQRMLASLTQAPGAPAGTSPPATVTPDSNDTASPWAVRIEEVHLNNNRLAFSDASLAAPFSNVVTLDATLSGLDNAAGSRIPVTADLSLDSGGNLAVEASIQALPELAMTGTLAISDLALATAQPYLADFTALILESGELQAELGFRVDREEPLALTADLAIVDLAVTDSLRGESLLALSRLAVDQATWSSADNRADISEIAVTDLTSRVVVYEDATTNISRSLATESTGETADAAPPTASTETPAATSPLPSITLGRLRIDNAGAEFTDRNLPLVFNASIQQLNGVIDGISNTSRQATAVALEGQVGEFGLLQLNAELNPFDFTNQSDINLVFTNIDLPSVTPYAIKFAGREVDAGDVDLKLTYQLLEGQLTANNQMVLNDLQLGDRVEQPGAMDLPLDLALALLKDGNGVIDLEIPVTGNVNDPEFNFGPAIRRAITNILTNIVAAPFRLLGSLIGGGDAGTLDHIRFLPGRSDVAAPEQQVLLQLGEALQQRPQLQLEIPLVSAAGPDTLALQTRAVAERIDTLLAAETDSAESLTVRRTRLLESLYFQSQLLPGIEAIQLLHTPEATTDVTDPQLDLLAYTADLRERLIAAEPVSPDALAALAAARAAAVEEFLVTSGGIERARIRITEPVTSDLDDEGWLDMSFGLGSN